MGIKKTTEQFITEARLKHGDKYDYSKAIYSTGKTKVIIICNKHGAFKQIAYNHLIGQGCPECGKLKCDEAKKCTQEEFITRAKIVHKGKYTYDKVDYVGTETKVTIICPEHGEFLQTPHSHLRGSGCNACGRVLTADKQSNTKEDFIANANVTHKYKYSYSNVVYKNSRTKVTITCPIHGDFEQIPKDHLAGCGCSSCMACGFDKSKPAILYYLKIITEDNQLLYKVGITNRTVNERFNLIDLSKIEIIKQKIYSCGVDAYECEQNLLKQFKKYQYTGPNILESGNTELFTEDILLLHSDSGTPFDIYIC